MHVTVLTQAKLRNELFGDIAPGVLILAAVLYALCGESPYTLWVMLSRWQWKELSK